MISGEWLSPQQIKVMELVHKYCLSSALTPYM